MASKNGTEVGAFSESDIEELDSIYRGENQPELLREIPPIQIIVDSIATRT